MDIRSETENDADAIGALTTLAFNTMKYSVGTEAAIVAALRESGALTLSLVAVEGEKIIGHVAFSPITINGEDKNWFGLGPVSVAPERQGKGIGSALIGEGLRRLLKLGANGCVLMGEPNYYGRFGFRSDPALTYGSEPSPYFQRLVLKGAPPRGEAAFHESFGAS